MITLLQLQLTPQEFEIWIDRFELDCCIVDALEYSWTEDDEVYIQYHRQQIYIAIDQIKVDEDKRLITFPDSQIHKDIVSDCVTGSTYVDKADDAAGVDISHQKYQSIVRSFNSLEKKIEKYG